MENFAHITHFGLPGIDRVPLGMHACHFYKDRDQLIAALVPYFVAGLQGNERCLWVAAPPLPAKEAIEALRDAWDGVDDAVRSGALRIIDFEDWYLTSKDLKGLDVVELWIDEEERALADGYDGLRIAGNTSFLAPADWAAFMEYERAVSARFHGRHIVALCSYSQEHCHGAQISEAMEAHHCTLQKVGTDWEVSE
jgi:hypothetical protein